VRRALSSFSIYIATGKLQPLRPWPAVVEGFADGAGQALAPCSGGENGRDAGFYALAADDLLRLLCWQWMWQKRPP